MSRMMLCLGLTGLFSLTLASAADKPNAAKPNGNRLTYLDEPCNPYYVHRDFPKLTTPMWVGEEGVEAVVILGIDDMRGHEKWETYLRPILNRLKQIDGRAPVSIMTCTIDPKHPHLQQWLEEGLSLEVHTIDHPCPLLGGMKAKGGRDQGPGVSKDAKPDAAPLASRPSALDWSKDTYDRSVDLLSEVPNNKPVCFRMPCCDSLNTLSPRFFTEIFAKTTEKGHFLQADSSVFNVFTSDDPALPRELVLEEVAEGQGLKGEGEDKGQGKKSSARPSPLSPQPSAKRERFRKYIPADRFFANTIENYPYPYVIDRLCWEFPCVTPSDWSAQHLHKPHNPQTIEDWKAALDCTVIKQGVFCLVFHPHNWIKPEQINELIDHAVTKHGKKVKFLNFREAVERLNKNVLGGQQLVEHENDEETGIQRAKNCQLLDLNGDGFLDVVRRTGVSGPHVTGGAIILGDPIRIEPAKVKTDPSELSVLTRLWQPSAKSWSTSQWRSKGRPDSAQFAILRNAGMPSWVCVRDKWTESDPEKRREYTQSRHFDGRAWSDLTEPVPFSRQIGPPYSLGWNVSFVDIDRDGRCELVMLRSDPLGAPKNQVALHSIEVGRLNENGTKWVFDEPIPFRCDISERPKFSNSRGGSGWQHDFGVRYVDLNEDGFDDLVISNSTEYSIRLFEQLTKRWSKLVFSGQRGDQPAEQELPPIVRADGSNNGFWVHSRHLIWMNEDTAKSKDLVERRSFDELLAKGQGLRGKGEDKGQEPRAEGQGQDTKQSARPSPLSPQPSATPDGPKSPEASLKMMQVKPGYRVELVAAEPLVRDPVAFDWGPDGKLWVAEMADYPLGVGEGEEADGEDASLRSPVAPRQESRREKDSPSPADSAKKANSDSADPVAERQGYKRGGGRVRFLEDTNGDGKYDKSTVFLDKLHFPNGVMPWRDGVLISAAPDVLFARDTNGDGKADDVKVLLTGFGEGNQQHRVNGFSWGLDNMVHCANGDSGGSIRVVGRVVRGEGEDKGKEPSLAPRPSTLTPKTIDIRGRDFRWNPDTGELDPTSGQTQFGRNRDDFGNWFGNNNANPMYHFVLDDFYTRRNPHVAPPDPKKQASVNPGPSPVFPISRTLARFNDFAMANRFTSANSAMVYRDELLFRSPVAPRQESRTGTDSQSPADSPKKVDGRSADPHVEREGYIQHVFISEPVHNLVHHEVMTADGVTFTSRRPDDEQQSEFVASRDNWFRPTQIKTGPDGALYIADMYRQVIEHPQYIPPAMQEKLDLRAGHDKGRIYRVIPSDGFLHYSVPWPFDKPGDKELVRAIYSSSGMVRDLAHRMLLWRHSGQPDKQIVAALRKAALEESVSETEVRGTVGESWTKSSPLGRLHALSLLDAFHSLTVDDLPRALQDKHPAVRRRALQAIENLEGDLPDSLINQLSGMGRDPDPFVRMQFAYTLGHPKFASLGHELGKLLYRERDEKYLVAAAMSSIHAKNVASVVANVFESAGKEPLPPQLASTLLGLASTLGNDQALLSLIEYVLSGAATTESETVMLATVLETLDRRGTSLGKLNGVAPQRLALAEQQLSKRIEAAREEIANCKLQIANLKLEAVNTALPLLGRVPDQRGEDAKLVGELLVPQAPVPVQTAVVATLARINHDESAAALLGSWRTFTPALRGQVLDALLGRAAWTDKLLDALEAKSIAPSDIDAARRQRLVAHSNEFIRTRAAKLLEVSANADRQKIVAEFAAKLKDGNLAGDATRGGEVFKKRCATCHKLKDIGTSVGADLVALTDKSTAAMLTAILDPNKAVEAKFLAYSAVNKQGQLFSGMIAAETGNSITLMAADGKQHTLLRADLDEFISSGKSFMPEGLEKDVSPSELADVITFVQSSGPPPKRFDGNHPEAVTADANGTLKLLATNAEIYGKTLVFEPQFKNLGYWGSVDDRAVWTINVAKPGKHSIRLNYACDNSTAGNEAVFEVADQSVKAKIVGTGSWENYQTAILGEFDLPAGQHRLTVRSAETLKNSLLDLKELRLVPE